MKQLRLVVLGTGTEVGKTHFGLCVLAASRRSGLLAAGLKPVESGVGQGPTDGSRLGAAGLFHVKQPPYAFPLPISPHLAARHAGIRIDLSEIRAWVELHAGADLAVIETAGGAFSPLGSGITNADLALALAPDAVILVALDRLGVLHDVTAARAALRTFAPALPAPIVVLQAPASLDASTGTNAAELLSLSIVSEVWSFPRAEPDSPEAAPVADALLERLRRR